MAVSMFDRQGCHVVSMCAWSPCVDDYSTQQELRAALTGAIDELPSAYRTGLVLRDVQGLSNPETAELLSLSVPVVKTRAHRARLFLRKELVRVNHTPGNVNRTPPQAGNGGSWPRASSRIPKTSEIRFPFVETKENGQPDQS